YPAWFPDKWRQENARMARAMELSDHVFYQSEFCKKSADTFLGVRAKSYDILYNGVDTESFKPIEHSVCNDYFTFLLSGNISASTYYRLTNALDGLEVALRNGLNVKINFSGLMPQTLEVQFVNDIEKRNLQDRFLMSGAYSRKQAPQIFGGADAYLITKHNDPCPNVVLEAMACGLPILYAASGGVPELVGGAGVSLAVPETYDANPVPTAEAIAEGMAKIIYQRDAFSSLARERAVQKFDIQLWAQRHKVVFDRLVNGCQ
ncbi:MAG: glycosyltransferase family 4 protein, partial [Pseudomonadota bacterium]